MSDLKALEKLLRGWLPKEPSLAYPQKTSKPMWKPILKTLSIGLIMFLLIGTAFFVAQAYIRYSNPKADITASYYGRTVNSTTVNIGDVVEVKLQVYWHGHILPEFKRDIKIVDSFPESQFTLMSGTNVYESKGYGGSYLIEYSMKAREKGSLFELSQPRLYLDNFEIPLTNTNTSLQTMTLSNPRS